MKRKFVFLLISIFFLQCGRDQTHRKSEAERILATSCEYLWKHQSEDGGWHSEVHGLMRSGKTLTPFILFALMDVPDSVFQKPKEGVKNALEFIRSHTKDGVLGLDDPDILEYPNYSTAYALRVLVKHGSREDSSVIRRMVEYLVSQQFTEQRGIALSHAAYGSWGLGELRIPKGKVGHVDISHTRHILQALDEAGYRSSDMFKKATRFLRLLQKHPSHESSPRNAYDGGFYFAPSSEDNKAGRDSLNVFRSYATPTCGGILSLLATGHTTTDEPVQTAVKWLEAHPSLEYPEGIPENDPDQWRKVLFFQHLSSRSETYRALNWKGDWRMEMAKLLVGRQAKDGSFSNPYGAPNKEDDPLLATAFVVGIMKDVLW